MMLKLIFIVFLCSAWIKVNCQNDTIFLPEVTVLELPSFVNVPGQAKQVLKSIEGLKTQSVNLSEILNMQTNINVRSYGNSGISTISVRGSGPSHTGIVWNGFNIQNIQNGQFDFSSIQTSVTDQITIIYGGTGAQTGSGSIGGTIFIDNELLYGDLLQAKVQTLAGSFGHYSQYAKIESQNKKISCNFSFLNDKNKNNFTYKNSAKFGNPVDTVKNGATNVQSLTANAIAETGKNSSLKIHFWGENRHCETPGTMVVPQNGHYIDNQNLRSGANWQWAKNKININLRSGYFYGKMDYFGFETSNHITNSQINEISIVGNFSNWKYKISSDFTYEWLNSSDLTENPKRQKTALFALLQKPWNWGEAVVIARQEFIDRNSIPFTPAAGVNFFDKYKISLSAFVSRSYRLPTFNDLFWTGWGNPNLKPEDAINTEMSIKHIIKSEKLLISNRLGTFYNDISKMIVWLPVEGTTIWRPENINKIQSYGIEFENTAKWLVTSNLKFYGELNYTWVKSLNERKQSIYVPEHKGGMFLSIEYKKFNVSYNHIFTGERFTNVENTTTVDAFQVANLRAGIIKEFKNVGVNITAGVNNLYNSEYQVVRFYPTPPRHFDIAITFSIKD